MSILHHMMIAMAANSHQEPIPDYLCFTALESGTFTLSVPAAVTSTYLSYVEYSLDGQNWTRLTVDSTDQTITTPTIAQGDKVYWRGSGNCMTNLSASAGNNAVFSSTARFDASGHLLSLLKGDDFSDDALVDYTTSGIRNVTFANLFRGCTTLVNAVDLVLPQFSSFYTYIYISTFYGCTSLLTTPALPCTTLANSCYQGMFQGCSSLAVAPSLPATTLVTNCYYVMFSSCTSLTEMPVLSATALATNCYRQMFQYCSSLTTTHDLPATTLASDCYRSMFYRCSALVSAPKILATTLAQNCCNMMFRGCTSLTSAPQLLATTLATSCYQEMFGGCTSLAIAPELPSTTLVETCYKWMFNGCTSLSYVKCLATNISATDCLLAWTANVSSTGTFIQASGVTWPRGASGIPTNWLIVNNGSTFPTNATAYDWVSSPLGGEVNTNVPIVNNLYGAEFEYKFSQYELEDALNNNTVRYVFRAIKADRTDEDFPKQTQVAFYVRNGTQKAGWVYNAGIYVNPTTGAKSTNGTYQMLVDNFTDTASSHIVKGFLNPATNHFEAYFDGVQRFDYVNISKMNENPVDVPPTAVLFTTRLNGGKMYRIKFFADDGTTIVGDLVPCVRNSDSVAGLWDKVNLRFVTSNASKPLTAGNEI